MPEVRSTQTTAVAAGSKLLPSAEGGKRRIFFAEYLQGASTQAVSDTIYLGDIPEGARICKDWLVSFSTGTASCALDVGFRNKATQAVIDVDGIAAAVAVTTAGQSALNNGSSLNAGLTYITPDVVEVYATIRTAVLAANQRLVFEGTYVQD
jgi:hypothetical protein